MDSFSSPSGGSSPKFSSEDLMDQLKVQLAQAYAEEFLEVPITISVWRKWISSAIIDPYYSVFFCIVRYTLKFLREFEVVRQSVLVIGLYSYRGRNCDLCWDQNNGICISEFQGIFFRILRTGIYYVFDLVLLASNYWRIGTI